MVERIKSVVYGTSEGDIISGHFYTLNIIYGYGGDDWITGSSLRDVIYGGDDNDLISGGFARDHLYGEHGNDTIVGGVGDDVMSGGHGRDTFVVSFSNGDDEVTDWQNIDAIDFTDAFIFRDEIHIGRDENNNTELRFGDGSITLVGVSRNEFDASRIVAIVDDYAADQSTTGAVEVGGPTVKGSIEAFGDSDWFAVELEAGETYAMRLAGTDSISRPGTLNDPYLLLYDGDGQYLTAADNHNGTSNPLLRYTAAEDGTYYIEAAAYADAHVGRYALSVDLEAIA